MVENPLLVLSVSLLVSDGYNLWKKEEIHYFSFEYHAGFFKVTNENEWILRKLNSILKCFLKVKNLLF